MKALIFQAYNFAKTYTQHTNTNRVNSRLLFNQTGLGKTEVKAGMILIDFSILNLKKFDAFFVS